MAEAVFRHMIAEKNLSGKIFVDSCGTAGYHIGKQAHEGTRAILNEYGITHNGRASQLEKRHLQEFDGIVAMDKENLADIIRLKDKSSTAWVKLLSDFSAGSWVSVPDPWYTGNFKQTYELVTEGCEKLLEHLLK
jgi:protein-tyrosine phosphatase